MSVSLVGVPDLYRMLYRYPLPDMRPICALAAWLYGKGCQIPGFVPARLHIDCILASVGASRYVLTPRASPAGIGLHVQVVVQVARHGVRQLARRCAMVNRAAIAAPCPTNPLCGMKCAILHTLFGAVDCGQCSHVLPWQQVSLSMAVAERIHKSYHSAMPYVCACCT